MKLKESDSNSFFWTILFLLTGILSYWGLTQLYDILAKIIFGLKLLFDFSIMNVFYFNIALKVLVFVVLLILTVKIEKIKRTELTLNFPEIFRSKRIFRVIGISILSIFIIKITSNFAIGDLYEKSIQEFLEMFPDKQYYGNYIEFAHSVLDLLMNGLLIVLFFRIVRKVPSNE